MKLKLIMLSVFTILYGSFIYISTNSKNQRIELALNKQIDILQTHYLIAKNQFLVLQKVFKIMLVTIKKLLIYFPKLKIILQKNRKIY